MRLTTDFTSPAAVARMDRSGMIGALAARHAPEISSAWQKDLGPDRAAYVIDYIREAFMLPAPVADASMGRAIYARTCSVCHGERGDAASWARNSLNPGPANFRSLDPENVTRQRMVNTVTFGSPGTAMMPFATQYSRGEIAAVVDYIRGSFMNAEPEAPSGTGEPGLHQGQQHAATGHQGAGAGHLDHGHGGAAGGMEAPFPGNLSGDRKKGQVFYNANCAECHGTDGDGEGRRAYFMFKKPRNFQSAKARMDLNRPHLFKAIAMGVRQTEMAAWGKVLNAQQIADVAEYVFAAFINPETAVAPSQDEGGRHDHEGHDHEGHGHEEEQGSKKN